MEHILRVIGERVGMMGVPADRLFRETHPAADWPKWLHPRLGDIGLSHCRVELAPLSYMRLKLLAKNRVAQAGVDKGFSFSEQELGPAVLEIWRSLGNLAEDFDEQFNVGKSFGKICTAIEV